MYDQIDLKVYFSEVIKFDKNIKHNYVWCVEKNFGPSLKYECISYPLYCSCCSVFTARTRRANGAHTAFSRRAHSVFTAIIAFKMFYYFYFILSNPILQI